MFLETASDCCIIRMNGQHHAFDTWHDKYDNVISYICTWGYYNNMCHDSTAYCCTYEYSQYMNVRKNRIGPWYQVWILNTRHHTTQHSYYKHTRYMSVCGTNSTWTLRAHNDTPKIYIRYGYSYSSSTCTLLVLLQHTSAILVYTGCCICYTVKRYTIKRYIVKR